MTRGYAFSHSTAALLQGSPLPARFSTLPLHVSCEVPLRPARGRGIRGHAVRAQHWSTSHVLIDRPPQDPVLVDVTAGRLTWISLATQLDVPDLVAVGDAMLTRRIVTSAELAETVAKSPGGRGVTRARKALPLLRRGPMSRPETLLRLQIRSAGLPEPQINVTVDNPVGRPLFRPDLSWPDHRVLVEYEGDYHRVSRGKFRADIDRMEEFADAGWLAMRATGDDVFGRPDRFLGRLQRRLVERGLPLTALRHVPPAMR
jgi:very-short-patch-repair endonuclease